jgi:hypothetical protein
MRFIFILLFLFSFSLAFGQFTTPEAISSGGDSYSQPFGKMEVTFGETVVETLDGNNIFLTQGFQQSNFFVAAVEEETGISGYGFHVYPNPTIDELNIAWDIDGTVMIYLYDLNGRLIYSNNMVKTVRISVADFASGAYLLRLSSANTQKTMIIQKLK